MSPLAVVFDTDFLSSFLKIDRLNLVRDFYRDGEILIPSAVFAEVSRTTLIQRLVNIPWVRIAPPVVEPTALVQGSLGKHSLGMGEIEAIALAKAAERSILLMNDGRARREAREHGVEVVDIPAFLLACKMSGFLTQEKIAEVVSDLQEKDWYGFRRDMLDRLLDLPHS